ncbi:MAG TPA: hypothetical protein VIM76_00230 [Candidatus Dormibacteraeota bacterium]
MTDAPAKDLTITPDGEFSLAAAASFGFGPNTGRPKPDGDSMSLAFVADDLQHHAAAVVTQDARGLVHAQLFGDADAGLLEAQVRRILSLDHSGKDWAKVGVRDEVIGRLQREHPGLRPVLFHSPYEAAAWSVLSQRRHRAQATAVRKPVGCPWPHLPPARRRSRLVSAPRGAPGGRKLPRAGTAAHRQAPWGCPRRTRWPPRFGEAPRHVS